MLQSCPTLCNPVDGSPPASPVLGILQAAGDILLGVHPSGQVSSRRPGTGLDPQKEEAAVRLEGQPHKSQERWEGPTGPPGWGGGAGKLVLEKAEEPKTKLPISVGSLKKQESSRKTSISALLT